MAKSVALRKRGRTAPVSLQDLTPEERRQLEASSKKWERAFAPHKKAIRESERLTEADLAVRINVTR
jgi:hypothetical protein